MGFIVPEPMWDPVTPDIDPSDWEDDDE
jgi:hypothetical protein